MIVSFARQFVFIAVPKTAGHAIRAGLRPLMGPRDWEQCGLFEQRQFPPASPLAGMGHGHITAAQIREALPPGAYERLFSFAFVRNPFDRFVSYCAFIHRNSDRMSRNPRGTMLAELKGELVGSALHKRPQVDFLCDAQGRVIVDQVARVETIQSDFDTIRARLGADHVTLPVVNASQRRDWRSYYDDDMAERVINAYAADFDTFGYSKRFR